MTPLDICIFLLRAAGGIVDRHGVEAAKQILTSALDSHPNLPWKIAIQGLSAGDSRYEWAARVLAVHTPKNDGNAA